VTNRAKWLSESAQDGTRVWTISPVISFVDALADGVLTETGNDPLRLADVTVLVPTRRAGRALREAFLRRSGGKPLLLPRLMPLQDIDEDEALLAGFATESGSPLDITPAIAPLNRTLLLTKLILGQAKASGQSQSPQQAATLAQELARLLDQVQTECLSFDTLKDLVPDDLAEHWLVTLKFLQIVTAHWPDILKEKGVCDPAEHRNQVFAAQARAWTTAAPSGLIVAAGSTGTVPANRDLLKVVAALPNGCVVLPGLDQSMDGEAWDAVSETHPQHTLKTLLGHLQTDRMDVAVWPHDKPSETRRARQTLISEIMRPAPTSDQWRSLSGLTRAATDGIERIEAPTPREEAAAIALALRWAISEPKRTAALVTPDRALARRVAAELERWELEIDDSAGRPLESVPAGVFLRLTAEMALQHCAPVPLLSTLKHPMAGGGLDIGVFRDRVRTLERAVLRGPRPADGMGGLRAAVTASNDAPSALDAWLAEIEQTMQPFAEIMSLGTVTLKEILSAHIQWTEALSATDEIAGPLRLWAGYDGEAVARFAADLAEAAEDMPPISPSAYPGLLEALMSGQVVRPPYGSHPRLSILGPLEARLLHPDVLILGGLNEGTWPAEAAADPWMSRPMRKDFGLPLPERRIGQSAHDVAQGLGADHVILTRSLKVDGTPTVASRWWRRLDQVIKAAEIPANDLSGRMAWLAWAAQLARPDARSIKACDPPAPAPPVAARPRRMSVTDVETWMRDPYEIYAKYILRLRALDPIDADASSADYGTIVHDVLQEFIETYPNNLPADAEDKLRALANARFHRDDVPPGVMAFWQPRFARIATWVVETERERRMRLRAPHAEVTGRMTLNGPAGAFELTARADRIDELTDGTLAILDYKTGTVPTTKDVEAGYSPQLPLEAMIAAVGGFDGVPKRTVSELTYWKLSGRGNGGEERHATKDVDAVCAGAITGVQQLIDAFDQEETPYTARPNPNKMVAYGEAQHLARVKEWAAADGDES
jgi:ATP-dependent helicase/nuclease subunit B